MAVGLDNIIIPDVDDTDVFGVNVGGDDLKWATGQLEWEAEMRKLDMQVSRLI